MHAPTVGQPARIPWIGGGAPPFPRGIRHGRRRRRCHGGARRITMESAMVLPQHRLSLNSQSWWPVTPTLEEEEEEEESEEEKEGGAEEEEEEKQQQQQQQEQGQG
eukprot:8293316-Pyramimonas_sp.AAC.1